MNKNKTIEVEIPFLGFYETHHSDRINDAIGSELYRPPLDWHNDMMAGSYSPSDVEPEVKKIIDQATDHAWDVACEISEQSEKLYAEMYIEDFVTDTGLEIDPETVDVQSPQYYNFKTDRIFVTVTLKSLEKFLADVPAEKYAEAVEDNYTSYDGFMSFFSNDYYNHEHWTRPITEYEPVQIRTLLEVACEHKNVATREDRWYYAELFYESLYDIIPTEAYEKAEKLAGEYETARKIADGITPGQGVDNPDQQSLINS